MEAEVKETKNELARTEPLTKSEPIPVDDAGRFMPKSVEDSYRMAKLYLASKMLPARFNTPESIVVAMQYAIELGLSPLTGMRQIAVVQGTPCTYGDLPLALVQRSGKLESIKEYLVDKEGLEICIANGNIAQVAYAAVCWVKRKGDPEPREVFFSWDDAKSAGLGGSPTWKGYPKVMLKYRARSQALKDKFPDCLNGIAIAEYDYQVLPTEDGPALLDAAGDLNKQFVDGA